MTPILAILLSLELTQVAALNDLMNRRRAKLLPMIVKIVATPRAPTTTGPSSAYPSRVATGFFCDRLGHVVTNYHVVREASAVSIVTDDGVSHRVTSYAALDGTHDLAILNPPDSLKGASEWLRPDGGFVINAREPAREVAVVSYADNVSRAATFGKTTGIQDVHAALQARNPKQEYSAHKGYPVLILSPELTARGSSGAPILDMETGNPVGVVVGGVGTAGFFGFGLQWSFVDEIARKIGAGSSIEITELLAYPGTFEMPGDPYYLGALRAANVEGTRIERIVLDEVSGDPIPNATVILTGVAPGCYEDAARVDPRCSGVVTYEVFTNESGTFSFDVLLQDLDWRLALSHDLYETRRSGVFSRLAPDPNRVILLKRKPEYSRDYNLVFFVPDPVVLSSSAVEIEPRHWVRPVDWELVWDRASPPAPWLDATGTLRGSTRENIGPLLQRAAGARSTGGVVHVAFALKDGDKATTVSVPVYQDRAPDDDFVEVSGQIDLPRIRQEVCVAPFRGNKRVAQPTPVGATGEFTVRLRRSDVKSGVVLKAISSRCQVTNRAVPVDESAQNRMLRLSLEQRTCVHQPDEW